MSEQKFGVENLKTVLGWALAFSKELASALKDKKFKLFEALGFVDDLMNVTALVAAVPEIKNEISELSPEELQELQDYVSENFDFVEGTKVEDITDAAFDFISGATKLIAAFKK